MSVQVPQRVKLPTGSGGRRDAIARVKAFETVIFPEHSAWCVDTPDTKT